MSKRLTNNEFKEWMRIHKPEIELLQDYTYSKQKISCRCLNCNYIWEITPNSLKRGQGCPECARIRRKNSHITKGKESFVNVLKNRKDISLIGEYEGNKKHIRVQCNICNYIWNATPGNIKNGSGCPRCAKHLVYSNEEYFKVLKGIHPNVIPLDKYVNSQVKIKYKCKICGYEWLSKPNTLQNGHGCPNCVHTSTSYVEQFIRKAFQSVLGNEDVISRDKKAIGKEIDIYIISKKTGIEFGSWYWHKDRINSDINKHVLANRKGIKLITIYDGYDLSEKPYDDCITFPYVLSDKNHKDDLINLVKDLFIKTKTRDANSINWNQIELDAYNSSRRITTTEFKNIMKDINKDIEIIGDYINSTSDILVKCLKCGFEWYSKPVNLKQGYGCKKCGNVYSPTKEEFAEWAKNNLQNIVIQSEYINNMTPISCRCMKCGYTWKAVPYSLKAGKGCSKCSGNYSPTTEEFKLWMNNNRPEIIVEGQYVNNKTKIKCICRKCNHEWYARPHDLKRGSGCPKCANERRGKKKI